MEFFADLHIHSCFSRATSREMNLETIHRWAQLKGLRVVGTGDFTHPRWFAELQEKLEPAEPGLYKLRNTCAAQADGGVPDSCRSPVRFILSAEISTIYKKLDRTRKIHSVILAPSFLAAGRLSAGLQERGNIRSDGRPILGLDARTLLEMTLAASADTVFIPAHIWTPHFSVLGAASGFDSIQECFEDLTPHIFAVETGLSSDPPMNWMLSVLDDFVLVSNSDAHSPAKLAREANIFSCDLSYFDLVSALREKDHSGFHGTIEFFPEEGKYHYDGHRSCNVRLRPEETLSHNGRCPVCGKKITVGVMHRVKKLSDRSQGVRPAHAFDFENLIPLTELLADVYEVGNSSKKITRDYFRLLEKFGNELFILRRCDPAELQLAGYAVLAEAIRKMRSGQVEISPGYDGAYGIVRVCKTAEKNKRQLSLF